MNKIIIKIILSILIIQTVLNTKLVWVEEGTIITTNGQSQDNFGFSVKISEDTIVSGAPQATIANKSGQGAVYIFQNNGTNWNQMQILTASDGKAGDNFGNSLAIQDSILVIGAYYSNVSTNHSQGKVYVFQNNGTNWIESQILTASDGSSGDWFGKSVAINGNYIAIGAQNANTSANGVNQGKAYVFQNNGTNWNQMEILTASDGASGDWFGTSIGANGNYIVISSVRANVSNNTQQGKVYVFTNNGTNWIESEILTASDGASGDAFGSSIAILANDIIIGSPKAEVGTNADQGKAYYYQNNGSSWVQKSILVGTNGAKGDNFGASVDVSSEYLIVGGPRAAVDGKTDQGKAWMFSKQGGDWTSDGEVVSRDGQAHDNFGSSVSISVNRSAVGAFGAEVGQNTEQGKTYFVGLVEAPPPVTIDFCGAMFSQFNCTWEDLGSDISYDINYNGNWQNINNSQYNGTSYTKVFGSPEFTDITGNVDYSVQIRGCNTTTTACGDGSTVYNVLTRIDAVKTLSGIPSGDYIDLSWNYPDVPMENSVPKLNHYLISYKGTGPTSMVSVSNITLTARISNLTTTEQYAIKIWACRTALCTGEDAGEDSSIDVTTSFGTVNDLYCVSSGFTSLYCSWSPPQSTFVPYFYNLTYITSMPSENGTEIVNSTQEMFDISYPLRPYTVYLSACNQDSYCGILSQYDLYAGYSSASFVSFVFWFVALLFVFVW
ncbi:hypothetical protein M0811_06529 [Anaeramoeba ignava]|uniref:Fibronectin type-III domain-containing protein n=1 Tax=Anaeramoeba ignava TaxID=1746090 RepID=A0A9Q0LS32_ANAIG|nr:hypothetical protein M0811_06529 [Anaeramoeba ignava]